MARTTCLLVALASLMSLVNLANGAVPLYDVQFLGAGWTATGINEHGDVCGNMSPDGTALLAGVSRDGEPFTVLPLPAGMSSSRAHGINDGGVIVGSVCPNQYVISQPTAAVWRPIAGGGYEVEVLSPLPGDQFCDAYAINNVGDILGGSGFWGWNLATGVLFTANGPVALPEGIRGADINDRRVVVSGPQLLDLDTGQITTIPLPEGNWSGFTATALNDSNDVCGYIAGWSGCSRFPLRHRQDVGWEYLGGCATTTSATAINNRGDALLYYYMTTAGVSFVDHGYYPLGSLIDPSAGVWFVQYGGADGINDARQIVASARQGMDGPIGAILMTPVASGPTGVAADLAAPSLRVIPNPSTGAIQLVSAGKESVARSWSVYDVAGRRRASFTGDTWSGKDDGGERLPSGGYFIRPADGSSGPAARLVRR